MVPSNGSDKRYRFFMFLQCFTRETSDQRCAQNSLRKQTSDFLNSCQYFFSACSSSHPFQYGIAAMLCWNIEVWKYMLTGSDGFDQPIFHLIRIHVENTDPVNTFNLIQSYKKFTQMGSMIHIKHIACAVLCHKCDFLYAIVRKSLCLVNHFFHIFGFQITANQRNGTESTAVQTAIADRKISHPWFARKNSWYKTIIIRYFHTQLL